MVSNPSIVKGVVQPFEHRFYPATGQNALYSTRAFTQGQIICEFCARAVHTAPGVYTLQAGVDKHISLGPPILSYTNHSCRPTTFFNTTTNTIEAIEDIKPGDQITFFYPSTEYKMGAPFQCSCDEDGCLGMVLGAKGTSPQVLQNYRLNKHIQEQLKSDNL